MRDASFNTVTFFFRSNTFSYHLSTSVALHHLPPSSDADEDVPEVNRGLFEDSDSSDDFNGF